MPILLETIRATLKAILPPILASRRVTFMPSRTSGGTGFGRSGNVGFMGDLTNRGLASSPYDLDGFCGDVLDNSVVAACVNAIAQALPEAPILLEKRVNGVEFERIDSHPVLDLLHNPNPYLSEAELWGVTTAFERTRGEAFWYFEYDESGRVPREIWFRAPQYVQTLSDEQRFISGYLITSESGQQVELDERDVVHFRHQLSARNPRAGWSPIQTGRRQIVGDNSASVYHSAILRNAGAASLIISLKDAAAAGEVTPGQLDEYVQQFKRKSSGAGAGAILGMDLPLDVHKVGFSPDEMALEKLLEYYESRICALMGVNRRVINLGQDPTYENSRVALGDFWERTIIPMRRRHAATLSSQILPLFGLDPSQYRLSFDFSEVEALAENVNALHTRWRETLEAGGVDLFTFQEKIGLVPDEKLKGRFVKVSGAMEEAREKGDEIKASREWNENDHQRASDGRFGSVAGTHVRGIQDRVVQDRRASHGVEKQNNESHEASQSQLPKGFEQGRFEQLMGRLPKVASRNLSAEAARKEIVELHNEKAKIIEPLRRELAYHEDQRDGFLRRMIREKDKPSRLDKRDLGRLDYVEDRIEKLAPELKEHEDNLVLDKWKIMFANERPAFDEKDFLIDKNLSENKKESFRLATQLAARMVGCPVPPIPAIHDFEGERSHYDSNINGIKLGQTAEAGTVIHEMGHWLEAHDPHAHREIMELLERRKINPDPNNPHDTRYQKVTLRERLNNKKYKPDEVTIEDQFIHPYMGKIYADGKSSEILSMGIEYMVKAPEELAKGDPEMFDIIYNILRRQEKRQ